jgi:hypothetical protein
MALPNVRKVTLNKCRSAEEDREMSVRASQES